MLERVIERVRQAKLVDEVVVASPHQIDCSALNISCDATEDDVLKRYAIVAAALRPKIIVRITSDCPLIDPEVIDMAISYFNTHDYPYVYFAPVDGLDVEVFTMALLMEANENAISKEDREHVTPYMRRKTKISVDGIEDLERVRKIWNGQTK